jgi:phosphatidylglycerophosphatase C
LSWRFFIKLFLQEHDDILGFGQEGVGVQKKVAVFDFDHTLILGDSFFPYMIYVAGRVQTYMALLEGMFLLAIGFLKGNPSIGWRTFLKAHLLRRLLAGRRRDTLDQASSKVREWQKQKQPVMEALFEHSRKGDMIVIASGGLDLYLPELLRDIPHNALICTDIGVQNGIVTGEMINGNCVRLRKAERVAQWLAANGPFEESWGYGNYPHDLPMLELLEHRIVVS